MHLRHANTTVVKLLPQHYTSPHMGKPTPVKVSMNTAASPTIRATRITPGKGGGTSPKPYSMSMRTTAKPSINGGRASYKEPSYGE